MTWVAPQHRPQQYYKKNIGLNFRNLYLLPILIIKYIYNVIKLYYSKSSFRVTSEEANPAVLIIFTERYNASPPFASNNA